MAKLYLKNEIFTVSGSDTGTNINGSTEVYGTTWGFGTSTTPLNQDSCRLKYFY